MSSPFTTLGALTAHMQAWNGSGREASQQVALAAELLAELRDRAARAHRREQAERLGLPSNATDDEIAEAAVRAQEARA